MRRRFSRFSPVRNRLGRWWMLCGFCGFALAGAGPLLAASGPPPAAGVAPAVAPVVAPEEHDVLVFADGDRTHGELVRREGKVIVFRSLRFGELRVPEETARVIRAVPDASIVSAPPAAGPSPATPAAGLGPADAATTPPPLIARSRWTSPAALAESLRNLFGQWRGRFSFAASSRSDSSDRSSIVVESKLGRKWPTDEINIEARYESATTNDAITTDIVKGTGSWRHDLARRYFVTYRPTLEWNRNYRSSTGNTFDYVLVQQEVGVGVNLLTKPGRKVRLGVAENLFNVWVFETPTRREQSNAESIFAEFEVELPWRIALSDRGILYYSLADGDQGWENRFEVNKKLTETLSLSLRHEYRRNSPDIRVTDYAFWRFLVGFDF